ncbi:hypothetical protein EUTSA_v10017982mg [Eutrema salsugineum]|uniref:Uncharacterized protein n=1 Tax=Eutrema salsugineum TaxID=72664 RepID=V4LPW1_EUTSA|nr:hypothetical protein EUTSA_v10017982mg [Eutrema salsugineum]
MLSAFFSWFPIYFIVRYFGDPLIPFQSFDSYFLQYKCLSCHSTFYEDSFCVHISVLLCFFYKGLIISIANYYIPVRFRFFCIVSIISIL